ALLDPLDDFLVYATVDQLLAHADGVLDRPAVRSPVTDQTVPADPQQWRAAVLLPVVLVINLLHHRLELLEQVRRELLKLGQDRLEQSLGDAFGELEDDVA